MSKLQAECVQRQLLFVVVVVQWESLGIRRESKIREVARKNSNGCKSKTNRNFAVFKVIPKESISENPNLKQSAFS